MTTFDGLHKLPPSAQARIASGEFSMHLAPENAYGNVVTCITIPFSHYLMLEQNLIIAKSRRKK